MNKYFTSILMLMAAMFFVSCSGNVPPMQKDFPDAVTCLSQVDPYYRAYFSAQNGSNYTLADQRRAYLAAMQTARTPVRASDYRQRAADTRLATRSTGKAGRSKASRGKVSASRRAVAKRGTKAQNRRATASRRTARRGARRRG